MEENIHQYPTDPKMEPVEGTAEVVLDGVVLAKSNRAISVKQKGLPPTIYFPPKDVKTELLKDHPNLTSYCPWKGDASYWDVELNGKLYDAIAWSYKEPLDYYVSMKDYISFYPAKVDQCILNGEVTDKTKMPLSGGWITKNIKGVL